VSEVRQIIPSNRALFVRISATDWVDGGWDIEESIALCRELQARGVDLIDCSTGGLVRNAIIPVAPGFQATFAERIHQEVGIATCAVGMITTGAQAEELLESGDIDAVMIGRAMLGNPRWALQAAADLGDDVPWPNQYARGYLSGH